MTRPIQDALRGLIVGNRGRASTLLVAGLTGVSVLAACSGSRSNARSTSGYPRSRTVDSVGTWHGTNVADPYRWLEDLGATEVRTWAAAQTSAAQASLRDNRLRPWLFSRIEHHAMGWDTHEASAPAAGTQTSVRLDQTPGSAQQQLIVQPPSGTRRVLVDPLARGPGRAVSRFVSSPDGSHVVYWVSTNGSEWVETFVVRVSDGSILADSLDGLRFAEPVWTHDSRGFFYVRYERPRRGETVALREPSLWYHRLGTAQEQDRSIYRTAPGNVEMLLGATLTPDGRYLFITEGTEAATEGLGQLRSRMMLLDLVNASSPDVTGVPTSLSSVADYGYRLVGQSATGLLHVLTDRDAPRRKLVSIDPRSPAPQRWRDVIAEGEDVLHALHAVGGRYVAHYLRDAQAVVRVFAPDGRLDRTIDLPPFSSVFGMRGGARDDELVFSSMTFLDPPTWWHIDLATGRTTVSASPALSRIGGPYETTRVRYPSKDGTLIPMFLVHRKGLVLDGSHPVLMYGYGASHDPSLPTFDEGVQAWLELGGVYASPNLRGGGEFGRTWYEAATLERKQHTFDDFIAAAEWLIRERWTSPSRLAIRGASNGGLLVTGTIAQRPDLFAVAVAHAPQTDGLRFERGRHTAQFGTPSNPAQFPFLYAYSPLHRLTPNSCYPATFLTAAFNDERVPAWHAFKFAAALQAAQACNRPIALRVDASGGHMGLPQSFTEHQMDMLTFISRGVGIREPPSGR